MATNKPIPTMTVGEILKALAHYNKNNEVQANGKPIEKLEIQCTGYVRIIEPKKK